MADNDHQPSAPVASASTSSSSPSEINLLTLNCWGLLHISALRSPRISHIGRSLSSMSPPPDIVCLQELFTQQDYRLIRLETRQVLPYGKFYHSGAFGGGLAVLSRWPIQESSMFPYPLNGRPTAFWRGDWYVGKGIACARIRFGPGPRDVIEVFNTHTHAPYEHGPNDSYICHRTAQAWEMSKLLRGAAERGHLVAALGDFNMLPLSLAHRLITSHAPVRDVWRVLHPDSSLGASHHPAEASRSLPVPTVDFNLRENGATSNNTSNTWRWNKNQRNKLRSGDPCPVDIHAPDPHGQRLDYIFTSTGHPPAHTGDDSSPGWVVSSASVAMTHRHPDLHVSLSDHYAVQATLQLYTPSPARRSAGGGSQRTPSRPATSSTEALRSGAYLAPPDSPTSSTRGGKVPDSDYDAQLRYPNSQDTARSLPVYDEILAMVRWYTAREQHQRSWRAMHFYASVVVWLACLVAVWFSPGNFVAFILVLVASLGLTAGVVNGLLALLFFSSELRSLKEFEWEIRNAKAVASGNLVALADDELDHKKG
ncbi:phospholipase C type enzyme [Amphichorda felina]